MDLVRRDQDSPNEHFVRGPSGNGDPQSVDIPSVGGFFLASWRSHIVCDAHVGFFVVGIL